MILKNTDGVQWALFNRWEGDPELFHAFSTRNGGVSRGNFSSLNLGYSTQDSKSNVMENRERLFQALGIQSEQTVMALQIHSSNVSVVSQPGIISDCDGLLTDTSGLFLIIGVADCHTLFLTDQHRTFVGALHSGWRGTADNILKNAVEKALESFNIQADAMQLGISPAIGGCCYEVGNEVANVFPDEVVSHRNNNLYLSMDKAICQQALELGIPEKNIFMAQHCTSCEDDNWYSYRRDNGTTGRMWGIIALQN